LSTCQRSVSTKMGKTPSSYIIHSLGGEYCWIVRDSETIRLLKSPRSLSVYILTLDILYTFLGAFKTTWLFRSSKLNHTQLQLYGLDYFCFGCDTTAEYSYWLYKQFQLKDKLSRLFESKKAININLRWQKLKCNEGNFTFTCASTNVSKSRWLSIKFKWREWQLLSHNVILNYQLKGITQTVYRTENYIHTQEPLEDPGIAPNVFKTFYFPNSGHSANYYFHVDKQIYQGLNRERKNWIWLCNDFTHIVFPVQYLSWLVWSESTK